MTRVRALKSSGLPRAFKEHRGHVGHVYRRYLGALKARLGPLTADAEVTLREAGRTAVELERLGEDLERARSLRRVRDAARIRRSLFAHREQLVRLERRLEEVAGRAKKDPMAAVHRAVRLAASR